MLGFPVSHLVRGAMGVGTSGVGRHGQAQAQAQVQMLVGGESGSLAEAAQLEASERRLMLRAAVHKASAAIANR